VKTCPVCSTEYPDDVKFCPNDGQTLRAASPASDLVGQVIADRYHVVKKLGEGGMGQVYLAEHVKMGRRSAIKVMNPSMVHDPDAVARFNREASNASRITHPNVCAIYDFGETPEGLIYLAMEFIEGEPLTDLLAREGALKVGRAVAIFMQVAHALQAAHDLGIVHRDLKPDNIMLTKGRGGADVVKVVDFGIAKAVGGDEAGQKVTKTGLVVGTPEFMSPEQLSGDKLDGRSDLYSLALVFFKMLTGKLPFHADTVQETMIKRLTDEPAKLKAVRPDLNFPAGLQEALDSALTRTPVDRYQSVAKFAEAVGSVVGMGGEPGAGGGTEGKTQLLDAGATRAVAGQGGKGLPATAVSQTKKRALVPIVVGAIVVLGGGGAAVALLARSPKPAPHDSLATPKDTTKTVADRSLPDTTKTVAPPNRPDTAKLSKRPDGTASRPAGLTVAQVTGLLNMLPDSMDTWGPRRSADTALAAYRVPGLSAKDRADAACEAANAYLQMNDNTKALQWARTALGIGPSASCQNIVQNLGH